MSKIKEIKRNYFRQLRSKHLDGCEKLIFQNVVNYLNNLSLSNPTTNYIGIYWPLSGEVDLRPLLSQVSKPIALPCSHEDGSLSYHSWAGLPLRKDICGIPAPIAGPLINPEKIRLLLVPALAIDFSGIRLGYGKGYFDRLRSEVLWRSVESLVVLPDACVSSEVLPKDEWDIPFDGWISESGIYSPLSLK